MKTETSENAKPKRPSSVFAVQGVSPWPFDRRRDTGNWADRRADDVYGTTPRWVRKTILRVAACVMGCSVDIDVEHDA